MLRRLHETEPRAIYTIVYGTSQKAGVCARNRSHARHRIRFL